MYETETQKNADICRIQNYIDEKIRCPMDIEEQKALCRLMLYQINVLNIAKAWKATTESDNSR